jgi:hypothetical protein
MAKEFEPKTFVALTHGTIYSDFVRRTKEGKEVRDLITESRMIPLRSVVIENGKRVVLRYLAECSDSVVQEEQIKKGYPKANDPNEFSRQSMNDNYMSNGFITAKNEAHLEYLERAGFNADLPSTSKRVLEYGAFYKEYKPQVAVKSSNLFTKDQVKALSKFDSLNEDDQKAVLIKIKGSFYTFSSDKEDWYADITAEVNACTEENRKAIDTVLEYKAPKKGDAVDVDILIGKCIDKKLISFLEDKENVLLRSDEKSDWIKVFALTATLPMDSKLSLFKDYLKTKDGEQILNTIKDVLK